MKVEGVLTVRNHTYKIGLLATVGFSQVNLAQSAMQKGKALPFARVAVLSIPEKIAKIERSIVRLVYAIDRTLFSIL
jgi:hypothetical protein